MLDTFQPLLAAAEGLDLTDTDAARAELERRFDPASDAAQALNSALKALLAEGKIADRGEMPVKWGRVAKASDESRDFSIDVVHMNGAGPRHRHPSGEVNWCVTLSGEATFEGQSNGWVVMGPDSVHVPAVMGGEMLIVYLLPQGAMEFL